VKSVNPRVYAQHSNARLAEVRSKLSVQSRTNAHTLISETVLAPNITMRHFQPRGGIWERLREKGVVHDLEGTEIFVITLSVAATEDYASQVRLADSWPNPQGEPGAFYECSVRRMTEPGPYSWAVEWLMGDDRQLSLFATFIAAREYAVTELQRWDCTRRLIGRTPDQSGEPGTAP